MATVLIVIGVLAGIIVGAIVIIGVSAGALSSLISQDEERRGIR